MNTSRTTVAAIVVATALLFGAGGLTTGYVWGYLDSDGLNAAVDSAALTSALRAHRNGDTDTAVSLLESTLDSTLMERWSYDQRAHPLAGLVVDRQVNAKVMHIAADYRGEVKSSATVEPVRTAIAEVASRYKSAK